MSQLPLFPLNTVLFPGAPLNLHIFEERYQLMIGRCIKANEPFGVVLIKSGSEVAGLGPAAKPYKIGCTARIAEAQPVGGGRMNITAIGLERFRIRSLAYHQPYLVGDAEKYPLVVEQSGRVRQMARRLRAWLERYVRILAEAEQIPFDIQQLPRDSIALTYLAAALLQTSPTDKQDLLETTSALDLIERVYTLYRREVPLLKLMLLQPQQETVGPFSLN
jgi:Lon protease-like protein